MKSPEELDAIKEQVESLKNELVGLSDVELAQGTGGRAVTFVSTNCGKLVWKGRDCRIDQWYEQLCDKYFNDCIFVPRTVPGGDRFGFYEFIEHHPASEKDSAAAARNLGGFAALCTVLGSGDLGRNNVMMHDNAGINYY